MNDEEKIEIYNKGVQEGKMHKKPSQTTLELFSKMDTQIELMKKDILVVTEKMETLISDNKEQHSQIVFVIKEMKDEISCNYATKEELAPVKAIVYGMVGFILLSFLTAIISLVLLK